MLQKSLIALAVAAGIAAAAFWAGWVQGEAHTVREYEDLKAKAQKEAFALAENVSRKAAEIQTLKDQLNETTEALDRAARAAGGNRLGIGPDGLQRLERHWGRNPKTP